MDSAAGNIMLVCSANVCRSVYAAAVLADELRDTPISVSSAGVDAIPGAEPCEVVNELIAAGGLLRPTQFDIGAQAFDPALAEDSSLILTLTLRQRGMVARLAPSLRNRLFTLIEASVLAGSINARRLDPGGLDRWVDIFNDNRPSLPMLTEQQPEPRQPRSWWRRQSATAPTPEPTWDIPDAHTSDPATHRQCLAMVEENCRPIGALLASTYG